MQDAGPDLLIPAPPFADELKESVKPNERRFHYLNDDNRHIIEDRYKLKAKIEEQQKNQKVLERPDVIRNNKDSSQVHQDDDKAVQLDGYASSVRTVPPAKNLPYPLIMGGEDSDEVIRKKRLKIVEVRS